MTKIILLFLILSINAFGQVENNIETKSKGVLSKNSLPKIVANLEAGEGNLYKGYFYDPYEETGSLKEILGLLWNIEGKRIFSNKMDVMEDSTSINLELQHQLRYSKHVEDMLIETLQSAYSFTIRDTLLNEIETVYELKVIDPTRLHKHKATDIEICAGSHYKNYSYMVYNGYHLFGMVYILDLLKTNERKIDKARIPVVMDLEQEYSGLYNYAVPLYTFDENGAIVYFDSFLDMNQILYEFGLQVQKVTRPVMGKVVDFFDMPELERGFYKFPYKF